MAFLLDTDIWSYYLKGQHGVRDRVLACDAASLAISRVSAAELEAWAIRTESERRLAHVRTLCREVSFLDVDADVWQLFPQVRAELDRRGRRVGMSDVLIGCCAALHRSVVVSNNEKHFTPICDVLGLTLENWAAEGTAGDPDDRGSGPAPAGR